MCSIKTLRFNLDW